MYYTLAKGPIEPHRPGKRGQPQAVAIGRQRPEGKPVGARGEIIGRIADGHESRAIAAIEAIGECDNVLFTPAQRGRVCHKVYFHDRENDEKFRIQKSA